MTSFSVEEFRERVALLTDENKRKFLKEMRRLLREQEEQG